MGLSGFWKGQGAPKRVVAGSPGPPESVVAGMVERDPETHGRLGCFFKLSLENCREELFTRRDFDMGELVLELVDVNWIESNDMLVNSAAARKGNRS